MEAATGKNLGDVLQSIANYLLVRTSEPIFKQEGNVDFLSTLQLILNIDACLAPHRKNERLCLIIHTHHAAPNTSIGFFFSFSTRKGNNFLLEVFSSFGSGCYFPTLSNAAFPPKLQKIHNSIIDVEPWLSINQSVCHFCTRQFSLRMPRISTYVLLH